MFTDWKYINYSYIKDVFMNFKNTTFFVLLSVGFLSIATEEAPKSTMTNRAKNLGSKVMTGVKASRIPFIGSALGTAAAIEINNKYGAQIRAQFSSYFSPKAVAPVVTKEEAKGYLELAQAKFIQAKNATLKFNSDYSYAPAAVLGAVVLGTAGYLLYTSGDDLGEDFN
jgi:hypothetical protein